MSGTAAPGPHRHPLARGRRPPGALTSPLGLVASGSGRGRVALLAPGRAVVAGPGLVGLAGRAGLLRHRALLGPRLQLVRRRRPHPRRSALLRGRCRGDPAAARTCTRLRGRLHARRSRAHDMALRRAPARWRVPRSGPGTAGPARPPRRPPSHHGRRVGRRRGRGHGGHGPLAFGRPAPGRAGGPSRPGAEPGRRDSSAPSSSRRGSSSWPWSAWSRPTAVRRAGPCAWRWCRVVGNGV